MFRETPARLPRRFGSAGKTGALCAEIADAGNTNHEPFGTEKSALELEVATVTTELASCGDDAVAGHVGSPAFPHDVAARTRRSRAPGRLGDIAVGGDLADGNPADHGEDAVGEF